ncbi:hypothetical protein CEXT_600061 [Caerostris extrusa]|uniref:Uncharacterized protein n=1 Tax=Caerostris extrusa TaxID=172846 RepID=A0AAV4RH37_CAEEX|nr:hypothetical protein CEXT_600061 [Caerostris extrusa]
MSSIGQYKDLQIGVIIPSTVETHASLATFSQIPHWMGYRQLIGVNMRCDETVIALSYRQQSKDPLHPSPPDKPLRCGDKRQFIFCVRKSSFTR